MKMEKSNYFFTFIFFVVLWCNNSNCIALTTRTNDTQNELSEDLSYDFRIVTNSLTSLNFSDCVKYSQIVLEAIKNQEKWALKMFDSSAKFPVGLLHGNYYQLGNYDECVSIQHDSDEKSRIYGKYCLADIELLPKKDLGRFSRSSDADQTYQPKNRYTFKNTIHWAICVPSQCQLNEISTLVHEMFTQTTGHDRINVQLEPRKCHSDAEPEQLPLTTLEWVYGSVIGIFLAFITLSTIYHYYAITQKKNNFNYSIESGNAVQNSSLFQQVLECFSIINTGRKFLRVSQNSENASLECICGIRFISMCFIIAGHALLFIGAAPVQNTDYMTNASQQLRNAIFTNSPLLVDTFLLIGGFLMCFMLLQEFDKRKGRINFLILYIARYIRLTPSYLVILGFYSSFLLRSGSGPLWQEKIGLEQQRCLNSWWSNLLYINNYVNTDNLCIFQSWYLAVDYHLFIIAPFIIYPLWKWQKFGKPLLAICIFLSIVIPFWITFSNRLDPTFLVFPPETSDVAENFYFKTAYIKTHMRASSYFIGMFLGYFVYKLKTNGTKMSNWLIATGWIVSIVCGVSAMFSVTIFYHVDHEYSALEAALYAALHRVAWCISIGWILIVCITENATIVNNFLSWKVFIPLSRLTYCAYLVNGLIEIVHVGALRSGTFMNTYELLCSVFAHIVMTFGGAFLLCVIFESPIHGLEKILLRRERRNQAKTSNSQQEANSSAL